MFTQCAKCETVFRLSAEVLRAAGGQVRCGRCGEVFNALARLAEDANAFPAGESPLEMEERADEILHSTVPPLSQNAKSADDQPEELSTHDVEFARLQVLEKFTEDLPPAALPPAAPPPSVPLNKTPPLKAAPNKSSPVVPAAPAKTSGSVSPGRPSPGGTLPGRAPAPAPAGTARVAAPPPVKPAPVAAAPVASTPPAAGPPPPGPAATSPAASKPPPTPSDTDVDGESSLEFTLPPGELDRIFVDRGAAQLKPLLQTGAAAEDSQDAGQAVDAARNRIAGLEVPDDVRREMLSGIGEPMLPEISTRRRRELPRQVWQAAAVILALTFAAQLIHGNREWVGSHAPLRGMFHGVYAALGVALPAPATLSAYQLRQWGVTGEPGASGTLRVRASILNAAAQLQPYPLLRVTLANRFGTRIGARDFDAAEYMGKPIVRLLAPGERVDATLDIVDPGKDAEGFEIDVCLRGVDQRISCAGDAAAQSKK